MFYEIKRQKQSQIKWTQQKARIYFEHGVLKKRNPLLGMKVVVFLRCVYVCVCICDCVN